MQKQLTIYFKPFEVPGTVFFSTSENVRSNLPSPPPAAPHMAYPPGKTPATTVCGSLQLHEMGTEQLDQLCQEFTKSVFVAAGKCQPDAVAVPPDVDSELKRLETHIRKLNTTLMEIESIAFQGLNISGVSAFFALERVLAVARSVMPDKLPAEVAPTPAPGTPMAPQGYDAKAVSEWPEAPTGQLPSFLQPPG